MPNQKSYDCIIIGAGMSGLAAGIRLSMFNKKVLILEKHSKSGGLNSYYKRGDIKYDVGLHALTNYVSEKERGHPLNKLIKQLRIPYADLKLTPQGYSLIRFPDHELRFNNEIEYFEEQIRKIFPHEIDHFISLLQYIKSYDEVNLNNKTTMAKVVVATFIKDPALIEMIFCPLLIYGSAWENDMDFSQFVIMFKSIFLEGFSRPEGGVRTILDLLAKKYLGEIRYKTKVTKILSENNEIVGVEVNGDEIIYTKKILSSMGLPETLSKTNKETTHPVGELSFTESILITDKKPRDLGVDATIIFANERPHYQYKKPETLIDSQSSVLCFPNNFAYKNYHDDYDHGVLRVTNIANFNLWNSLDKDTYKEEKENVFNTAKNILIHNGLSPNFDIIQKDIFTPTTLKRYTDHFNGTVYGSTEKSRNGKTSIEGLYICGTDQGFLGIVGSMLSGISMANLHILSGSEG